MEQEPDEWEQFPPPQQPVSTDASPTTWAKNLRKTFTRHWQPEALRAPVVDQELLHLSSFERAAEVCRFSVSQLEYELSPQGHLRAFIKLNVRLALAIAVPVFLVAPLITHALEQLKAWIVLLTQTMSSFVLFPLSVILCILLVCGMIYIGRSLMELRLRSCHQRRDGYY